jgi:hypothetical protein
MNQKNKKNLSTMVVEKVIFSRDDSDYLNFWPHIAEITQKKKQLEYYQF